MGEEHSIIEPTDSLSDMCSKFGKLLGKEEPVDASVLIRAINEPGYGINLVTSKNTPESLNALLHAPQNKRYKSSVKQTKSISNFELIKKAAASFILWSKIGFLVVSNEILEKREDACLRCPYLTDPTKTLQKMIPSKKQTGNIGERIGKKVCGVCGCNLQNKLRLSSESCPKKHPEKEDVTRWDEKINYK
ncbi:MAG: hypothetical protein GXX78_09140 [Bacteroidales bacterium]|nr:hypothetical protein [Bacteroidales bacterium]